MDDPGIHAACCGTNTWTATKGSLTVFINGKGAHRMGDQNYHCGGFGQLVEGSPNVIVGESGGGGSSGGGSSGGGSNSGGGENVATRGVSSSSKVTADGAIAVAVGASDQANSFIEVVLVDEQGRPEPNARYSVTAIDGTTRAGTLDAKGSARIDHLPTGHVDITFPDLDAAAWGRT